MNETFASILPSVVALSVLAGIAVATTAAGGDLLADGVAVQAARRIAFLATVVQGVHFMEEAATGFNVRLPALFGLQPMPMTFFIAFNVVWLAIWLGSVWVLPRGYAFARFALWFLAIASIANAVIHPLLSIITAGYFPGLVTSPVVGIVGYFLLRRLSQITKANPTQSGAQ